MCQNSDTPAYVVIYFAYESPRLFISICLLHIMHKKYTWKIIQQLWFQRNVVMAHFCNHVTSRNL
jgi:hypothetical protein